MPRARAGQIENPARLRAAHELFERALDRRRVRPLAGELLGLFEDGRVKHKICPFHVFNVPLSPALRQAGRSSGPLDAGCQAIGAHVRPQCLWHDDRAVLLLIVLEDRDQRPADRET